MERRNAIKGIIWMVIMAACGSASLVNLRILGKDYSAPQLIFLNNLLSFALLLIVFSSRKQLHNLKTHRLKFYIFRSVLEVIAWMISLTALSKIPLTVHNALSFITPLFLSTGAVLILKEHTRYHTWVALFCGILGVLCVIRPQTGLYLEGGSMMLISSACFATCGLTIKKLTITEPSSRISFYMFLLTALFCLPIAAYYWKPLTLEALPFVLMLAFFTGLQQFAVARAFSYTKITVVLPFNFTSLVFTSILSYLFFHEVIDLWTFIGAAIILSSAIYASAFTLKAMPAIEKNSL